MENQKQNKNSHLIYSNFASSWVRKGGTVWLYSDPHFGDMDMYKLRFPKEFKFKGEIAPTDDWVVEQLDMKQVSNINRFVGKNDTIIFLGDIGNVEPIKKVRGYKVLIMGNHEHGASNYKRVVKVDCLYGDLGDVSEAIKSHFKDANLTPAEEIIKLGYKPTNVVNVFGKRYQRITDNHLFDEVYEGPLFINDRLILSHIPIPYLCNCFFNIHGHKHDNKEEAFNYLNICAEHTNYNPVNLFKLLREGLLSKIVPLNRMTIDMATQRKYNNLKKNCIISRNKKKS